MRKTYSSFEEINNDLQILKIQRDIHYHKIFRSVDNIKAELAPDNIVRNTFGSVTSFVKGSNNTQALIISAALKYFFKRMTNRKNK